MKGHIRQRGKQSWQLQVYTSPDAKGKYRRYYETVRGHKADAQRRLNEVLVNLDKGIYIPSGRMTLDQHFKDWLNGYVKTNCSQRTYEGYQSIIEHHLVPAFGNLLLRQLTPHAIQLFYAKATDKLANRTVLHIHRVLSQSLKYAVRQGYLGHNPCELVDPPNPQKHTMRTLTPEEVERLLDAGKDNYYYPVVYVALSTGLRQAELLGLRWRDVDLDMLAISVSQVLYKRGGVSVFKEPKTPHSRRRVAMTPKLAQYMRDYRAYRELFYIRLGRVLQIDDLVFTSITGELLSPSTLTHNFYKMVKDAGLSNVRFHDLRHTFASLMLMRGAKPKVISEALGHASVAFTMDTYSHIIEGMQEEAMALLDEVMPEGVSEKLTSI